MTISTGPLGTLSLDDAEIERGRAVALVRPLDTQTELGRTVCGALVTRARRTPDIALVVGESEKLTASELVSEVVAARDRLVADGLGAGDVVAVAGPRATTTLVSFLAIEAIDAIYLPVDPAWPAARITAVLRASGTRTVIVHPGTAPTKVEGAVQEMDVSLIHLEPAPARGTDWLTEDLLPLTCDARAPRYVIFTSGTTGTPKGAVIEHGSMVNHLLGKVIDLGVSPDSRIAFTAPPVFDISVWQMLVGPFTGATTVVLGSDETSFPGRMHRALARHAVTHIELVPTMISHLLDQIERRPLDDLALRWLISTGEELYPALARRALGVLPGCKLLNAYGPTECADDVTHHEVTSADTNAARLPVGGPVPNAQLHVLVEGEGGVWRTADAGEPGELFVGGVCVGLGYAGDPPATARAFFTDPFDHESPPGRLYRTGDLARVHDGIVHYLGRSDRQVKLSGVRMELGEIEATGEQHPEVARCAVVVREGPTDAKQLVAHVVLTGAHTVSDAELRAHFATQLPAALVPRTVVRHLELPITPNGKTDHSQLSDWRTS